MTIPYDAKALFQAELQFLANAIHQGQSPFWSPNVFGGVPQIADPQSLIFSPLVLLALLAPHPSFHALDVAVLALLALGGLAVLMFFRDRGWHPAGGIVAALAFAFGASAAWRIQHIGQIESLVFFAITLWLLARALDRVSLGYGLAAGIAAGLMVVQPDQVAFLGALLLVGYVDRPLARRSHRSTRRCAARRQAARGGIARRARHHRGAGAAHHAVRRVRATAPRFITRRRRAARCIRLRCSPCWSADCSAPTTRCRIGVRTAKRGTRSACSCRRT